MKNLQIIIIIFFFLYECLFDIIFILIYNRLYKVLQYDTYL